MIKTARSHSQDVIDIMNANPNIEELHYDEQGNHCFQAHKNHKGDLHSRIETSVIEIKGGKNVVQKVIKIGTPGHKIVDSYSREEVLDGTYDQEIDVTFDEIEKAVDKEEVEKLIERENARKDGPRKKVLKSLNSAMEVLA